MAANEVRLREAFTIVFVLIGLCYGVMHWRGSTLYGWLLASDPGEGWRSLPVSEWLFRDAGGGRTIHEALAALGAMLGQAALLGGATCLLLVAGSGRDLRRAASLAYGLVPLGGLGLFLGSLEHSFALLGENGIPAAPLLPWLRAGALMAAVAWSLKVGLRLQSQRPGGRRESLCYLAAVSLPAVCYQFAP